MNWSRRDASATGLRTLKYGCPSSDDVDRVPQKWDFLAFPLGLARELKPALGIAGSGC